MASMRVLITGGAGFIGSHLALSTLQNARDVRILDDLRTGDRRTTRRARPVDFVGRQRRSTPRPCGLLSQAWTLSFIWPPWWACRSPCTNPRACIETNVIGTLNVLRSCRGRGVRKLIFVSSAAIYGNDPPVPHLRERRQRAEKSLMPSRSSTASTL